MDNEDPDTSSDNEELYERLFPKIGRDFVFKEDLAIVLRLLINALIAVNPTVGASLNGLNLSSSNRARQRALEYKDFIKKGFDGSTVYKDLIDLEDV